MSSNFYIIPTEELQSEETWKVVLPLNDNIRLSRVGAFCPSDPFTGETLVIRPLPLQMEVYNRSNGKWIDAIVWDKDKITITKEFKLGDYNDPIWRTVSWLSQKVDGEIQGEDGKGYDKIRGNIISGDSSEPVAFKHETLLVNETQAVHESSDPNKDNSPV